MAKTPKDAKPTEPQPAADASAPKRKRNAIFVSLDDETEARLQAFIDRQRIKPDRAAVAFTALVEFLDREESARKKS